MDLTDRLERHLAQVAPHQRDREQVLLLKECLATINRQTHALEGILSDTSIDPYEQAERALKEGVE